MAHLLTGLREPPAVIVYREDRKHDSHWSPVINRRLPVIIEPENSPPPVPYTNYYGIGKTPNHAWPHRTLFQSLAIADRLAVAAPHFLVPKLAFRRVVGQVRGQSLPVETRVNIVSPRNATLGSMTAVKPPSTWSPVYAKLMR